ncbi:MAG: isoprenyl transferase [gamma proteobacterium symbiont of Bathyaustriella thionipta]|nr:isoprenyl transferase [gamma proteobacterium symbiont of Bathyaustriella thionipta]
MSVSSADSPRPHHVAIVMDGNGRWAKKRGQPRHMGHKAGVASVRSVVEQSVLAGVQVLTLFAFSSENWRRPKTEVSLLMDLFISALKREVKRLCKNNVRLRVIGDRTAFSERLQKQITQAEQATAQNNGLLLMIAANYGGRWDMMQAARQLCQQVAAGSLQADEVDEQKVSDCLSFSDCPDPDLFIRTGGEQRISNFILWQAAYTELYFTDILWPDFDQSAYIKALNEFAMRSRRFGKTTA